MEPKVIKILCNDPVGVDCDFNAVGTCEFTGYCDHKKLQGTQDKRSPETSKEVKND